MPETVMVLGSNSFSGSHQIRHLLEVGYNVVGVSRSPEPDPVFLPYLTIGRGESFSFHQFDLYKDLDEIMILIRKKKPAYIINFAAQGMVAESWNSPGDWFRTNTLAQVLLHDRLRQCHFLKKYVHVSTPEVYGPVREKKTEQTVYHPSSPYGISRAAADMSLHSFFLAYSFPVVFTRSGNVYGPGQQLYRLIPRTVMAALGCGKMQLSNGGRSLRSFVHIDDVATATRLVMERGTPGEIYHIATERLSTVREVAELTARIAGADLASVSTISAGRLNRDSAYMIDSTKIRTELGWQDMIDLERGIEETVAWVQDNFATLRQLPLTYKHII